MRAAALTAADPKDDRRNFAEACDFCPELGATASDT
jgi:hypothetical protein